MSGVIDQILKNRGLDDPVKKAAFCEPDFRVRYKQFKHDPFLLPDMAKAVERIVAAKSSGEKVFIYGDY
ncbi:MAG TPA: hypothetical protein VJM32_07150, partial [Candidatus Saccharimonadales bacterium]|nr:hypothetical protein [Candidatus Saccharimonadales bacterium]